ncbi:anaerobic glycerol-3-phosphate dehydrogenase subunit GlpA [Acidipropionibacterium jensenii]|uniref:anaerobic glycerol-3-phosphate dehydrogenase subunit GlpA n=2 Tax=Acidipropionibacterium jensenii TaxID=1749 RepID=UPI0026475CBB|nr:anaerobic glycerol-3-phosphate dehydrogenase subunit GlpA [Acidipropionibacterium jensenii]MDN5977499.1 anaerobic glycerol-3-phosphate dehydrogenase subunit A [Acidipropionibacterium jensenii]MDN5996252.1 anaerobic glycerol-3-phosphate dehydrogenase subunit A [Acidipropionibacterium jensenii]MDN6021048.1 anaerobic glycerol-3-phosphate dehydrogenase subunit A [Acidipropionibacterium jensenii]MDN6427572.1 anaerobic glycerol-3-phosphate dehydrogenase subunit A [Acidipropionibacterium jensenii]
MRTMDADVVVIGGGATGAGVVRDVAMRGYSAVLLDKADLGQGTTGRYHGLLHSGGRYVVSDPESATECAEENEIVTRIHADAVEKTGGLFVVTPDDPMEFSDQWTEGATKAKVPWTEISVAEALRREPRLNPGLKRAFAVQDGTVDGWQMVWGAAHSAEDHGAQVLTYTEVTEIIREGDQVTAVVAHDLKKDEQVRISTRFVINTAGPWAGRIADLVGCHDVEVVPGRGIMIAMNHRLVNTVVNRCIYPADGDILVPVHTVSIIGTTDVKADDPQRLAVPRNEVQQMLDSGEALIPGFRDSRAVHAWAGARPLFKDKRVAATDTRHMSRGMSILDHGTRDGVQGIVSIIGGKLTTYRLMAKNVVDVMCEQLGDDRPCTTDKEAVPGSTEGHTYVITHRLHDNEVARAKHLETTPNKTPSRAAIDDQIICECELMSRKMLTDLLAEQPDSTFDDLRRQLRLGMGPCQGGFCSMRATGVALEEGAVDVERATGLLRLFLKNRWIGLWPILYGEQVRQTALDDWIFQGTFDVEHLPVPESEVEL